MGDEEFVQISVTVSNSPCMNVLSILAHVYKPGFKAFLQLGILCRQSYPANFKCNRKKERSNEDVSANTQKREQQTRDAVFNILRIQASTVLQYSD